MEEQEFKRLLALFPVVRSRDFCADQDSSRQSTSSSMQDETVEEWHDAWDNRDKNEQNNERIDLNGSFDLIVISEVIEDKDAFWKKLKLAVERKVGDMEAEKFCRAFQQVHRKLVYEVMSVDAAKKYINSSSVPMDIMVVNEARLQGMNITQVHGTRDVVGNLGGVIYEVTLL